MNLLYFIYTIFFSFFIIKLLIKFTHLILLLQIKPTKNFFLIFVFYEINLMFILIYIFVQKKYLH